MREFSVPVTTEVQPDAALTDMLAKNVAEHGAEVGLRRRRDGQWRDVTWQQFGEEVRGVAKGLIASGVAAGDRVALQAKTRYEWTVLDFAIWTAGGVVVPVYDEATVVAGVIEGIAPHVGRVVCVDDGSRDSSAEAVAATGTAAVLAAAPAMAHHCFIPMYSLDAPASANWFPLTAEDGAGFEGYVAGCDAAVATVKIVSTQPTRRSGASRSSIMSASPTETMWYCSAVTNSGNVTNTNSARGPRAAP